MASLLPPLLPVTATLALLSTLPGQDAPVRFVPREPLLQIGIHDAPALLAALPRLHLGQLFADAEVAAAIEVGRKEYVARVDRWRQTADRMLALDPGRVAAGTLLTRAIYDLDWREVASGEIVASQGDQPFHVQTTMLLSPVPAAAGPWQERLLALRQQLQGLAADTNPTGTLRVDAERIDGQEALVLVPRADDESEFLFGPRGVWLLHLPGQIAGGIGRPEVAGACARAAQRSPGIALTFDLHRYLHLLDGGDPDPEQAVVLRALGLDGVLRLSWEVRPDGERLHDEIALTFAERPHGLLGALLDGMAPPVGQPLPAAALLQLRCAVDLGALVTAIDELLTAADAPTLGQLDLAGDLKQAFTGGVALAVCRPAPGGLVPRLYASFGIADAAAFARCAARLGELVGATTRPITYEGKPCVQWRLADAPPALQPAYCLQDGVVHFAESGLALRALLKAQAAGAPPELDVGDAPRPGGAGTALPGFDLRFDGAAIHAAIHELWLPLASTLMGMDPSVQPLVPMAEMPTVEAVTMHLRRGRGVLRRSADRIALAMSGTAGGPELTALLAGYGPFLSGMMTRGGYWRTEALQYDLARLQLERLHLALAAFEAKHGRRPASLGELVASGELADPDLLAIPGDAASEPVEHDGKVVARTSFRYDPDGAPTDAEDGQVAGVLTSLRAFQWRTLVLAADGTVHDSWGGIVFGLPGMAVEAIESVEVEVVEPPRDEPKPQRD
ncbi:MAG: hypothetical protein KF830_03420 [Planctomycetes bacterium]|nr:hypothetical protein [Planctomycetota bacterium]